MNTLIFGLIIFFGIHLLPSFTGFRQKIILKLGEGGYKGIYSIVSLLGLVLIIYGMSIAEFQPIFNPPLWGRDIALVAMLFSFYLLIAAQMKSNVKRFTRHPMLWGLLLWSGSHLAANGDLASIWLFGSFCVFSLFDMISANKRGAEKQAIVYPVTKDLIVLLVSIVVYLMVMLFLHDYLFGTPIV